MPRCVAGQRSHPHAVATAAAAHAAPVPILVVDAKPREREVAPPRDLLYWFSGTAEGPGSMHEAWRSVSGGETVRRDTKLDPSHDVIRDAVYDHDVGLIASGRCTRAVRI